MSKGRVFFCWILNQPLFNGKAATPITIFFLLESRRVIWTKDWKVETVGVLTQKLETRGIELYVFYLEYTLESVTLHHFFTFLAKKNMKLNFPGQWYFPDTFQLSDEWSLIKKIVVEPFSYFLYFLQKKFIEFFNNWMKPELSLNYVFLSFLDCLILKEFYFCKIFQNLWYRLQGWWVKASLGNDKIFYAVKTSIFVSTKYQTF
jgi:hypothetical protein